ncbi:YqgE/AlgH family protein [Kiritimatiellota bacterium B12222]|nr:YqgE/AlgH family protein [Kiritimatiellota bacterium B12222]
MKDSTHASTPQSGDVLIAHPHMPPNLFGQTIVFLHTHEEAGSLGLILNRPSGQTLGQLLHASDLPAAFKNLPVYYGGPVQDQHFLITLFHCDPHSHLFSCELNPDRERILEMIDHPHAVLRAFMGHAGWSAGQLEAELHQQDWLWTAPDNLMVSNDPTPAYWELLSRGDYRWQTLRNYFPLNPSLN